MVVTLKSDGNVIGRFKNPSIMPRREIGHGRNIVPWLPETQLLLNNVMPFNQLLEGFRNVDRPADGLLSPKEFTIFTRIQGDNTTRVCEMQSKLAETVNLCFDNNPEVGVKVARAFVESELKEVLGPCAVTQAMLTDGAHCALTADWSAATGPHPLVFFRGDEYNVEWTGIPRKRATKDVFRILSVSPDAVHVEGLDRHGAFVEGDTVILELSTQRKAAEQVLSFVLNGEAYTCEELGVPLPLDPLLVPGSVCTVLSAGPVYGSEVVMDSAGASVTFRNPRARGTFKNPENADEVSVDFCEWSAVLARAMFTSDDRIRTRVLHSQASHELYTKARDKFSQNVGICLDKTLPESGCDLQSFLTVLRCVLFALKCLPSTNTRHPQHAAHGRGRAPRRRRDHFHLECD